jgi:phage-related protein
MSVDAPKLRPIDFVSTARDDLRSFPKTAQKHIGDALLRVQFGGKPSKAKPLKGFKGASVLEIVADYDGDTYRAVYTVRLREAVYVRHCFQKKSTHGIATAKHDRDLIVQRLREAEAMDRAKGSTR